jgi:NitT/TauT family transport system permease protein
MDGVSGSVIERSSGVPLAFRRTRVFRTLWVGGLVSALAWLAAAFLTSSWPDAREWDRTGELAGLMTVIGASIVLVVGIDRLIAPVPARLRDKAPWLLVVAIFLTLWQVVTAKLDTLPMPFFPPPQGLLEVYLDDYSRLFDSAWRSLALLGTGYAVGAILGFITGVGIGWSRAVGYWVHPVLRLIGPLPATAWLPIAFFVFPSSWSASTFVIALATGFPVAILTWSGVASVNSAYYDIARTMGASPWFLVRKIAVPAAIPHVFVGLFMGLGASFAVLVVAEMMGVNAGLGWYLQWAQGWAASVSIGTQKGPRIGVQKGPLSERCCGLVQVANRRDPRALRSALTSDGAARAGGACLPTWAS